jgi:hypothetical protein
MVPSVARGVGRKRKHFGGPAELVDVSVRAGSQDSRTPGRPPSRGPSCQRRELNLARRH